MKRKSELLNVLLKIVKIIIDGFAYRSLIKLDRVKQNLKHTDNSKNQLLILICADALACAVAYEPAGASVYVPSDETMIGRGLYFTC